MRTDERAQHTARDAAWAPQPRMAVLPSRLIRAGLEVVLLGLALTGYRAARLLAADERGLALHHAREVLHFERWLDIPDEQAIQQFVLQVPGLVRLANLYYAGVHFPVTGLALVTLFLANRHWYASARTALLVSTVLGLAIHLAFPTAPRGCSPGPDS